MTAFVAAIFSNKILQLSTNNHIFAKLNHKNNREMKTMKKILSALALVAMVFAAGCHTDPNNGGN